MKISFSSRDCKVRKMGLPFVPSPEGEGALGGFLGKAGGNWTSLENF
ncbi:MAG: hypothetical protein H6Q52_3163, partial [Deltaproteobacteria bacterium]|nr:hypothetical protein [Deltaproteobacteria bacterium]